MITPLEAHAIAYVIMNVIVICGVFLAYGFGQAFGR